MHLPLSLRPHEIPYHGLRERDYLTLRQAWHEWTETAAAAARFLEGVVVREVDLVCHGAAYWDHRRDLCALFADHPCAITWVVLDSGDEQGLESLSDLWLDLIHTFGKRLTLVFPCPYSKRRADMMTRCLSMMGHQTSRTLAMWGDGATAELPQGIDGWYIPDGVHDDRIAAMKLGAEYLINTSSTKAFLDEGEPHLIQRRLDRTMLRKHFLTSDWRRSLCQSLQIPILAQPRGATL